MVIEFAKDQTVIVQELAPIHAVIHNFMMFYTDSDHHKFAREVGIDVST
jgi:beta-galactosidase